MSNIKPPALSFVDKLRNYLRASYPLLWVCSHEETRVIREITEAFSETKQPVNVYRWNVVDELTKYKRPEKKNENPAGSWEKSKISDTKLMKIISTCRTLGVKDERTIIVLQDFHHYIEAPGQIREIRNAIEDLKARGSVIIFLSPVIRIPVELEKEIQLLSFNLPGDESITALLTSTQVAVQKDCQKQAERLGAEATQAQRDEVLAKAILTPEVLRASVEAAKGMTQAEIQNAFSLAAVENRRFNNGFTMTVFEEKVQQVKRHGLLQYIKPDVTFDNVGGLHELKTWIHTRSKGYSQAARDYGLPYPRGVLLCGVPGTGKTLLAKATANEFEFPLFQLDIGALFDKHVGATEENFRRIISTVDGIGRCVLFIDEIEKSLNKSAVSGAGDTGTSSRAFATLLSWLSDHKSPVFVVATSNDHTKLPPEFTRKGRFDELFWIDLPSKPERVEIFQKLLARFNRQGTKYSLDKLAEKTEGYTGAEIENIITSAMFARFEKDGKEFTNTDLYDVIDMTKPMSEINSAELQEMREKAQGKLRPASGSAIVVPPRLEPGTDRNVELSEQGD